MASYKILWKRSAGKELKKCPGPVIRKIIATVETLAENPVPESSKKLIGTDCSYRIRFGDYRLVYNVFDQILTIEVIRIRHRKDVYRNLGQ